MTPGVYLDLPFEDYLAADALGSSDLKTLLRAAPNWWYGSRHNPERPEQKRERHFILGSALHALVLEGDDVFNAAFSVEPDPKNYGDIARTADDIRALFDRRAVPYKKSLSKSGLVTLAEEYGLGPKVWDWIKAEHDVAVADGADPITAMEYRGLIHARDLIKNHPQIGPGLEHALPEVSVFWHRDGEPDILYRARFDMIAPTWCMDLKTMSNWQGKDPAHAALRQIIEHDYHIQMTLYCEARDMLVRFVENGQTFADTERAAVTLSTDIRDNLQRTAHSPSWVWTWLFQQLRDDTGSKPKAPILIPRFYRPSNEEEQRSALEAGQFDVMAKARQQIDTAVANYRGYRDDLGFDNPWMMVEPVSELTDEDLGAAGLQYR